jgi:caffeoyl-CoA O-methyltransferase
MANHSPSSETVPAEQYLESLYENDTILESVKHAIRQHSMPEISIAPAYGRLLTLLVRISGAKRILEIGALGGYSGICLVRGLADDGKLISLELDPAFADVAKHNVTEAGFGAQTEYRIGEALHSLEALEAEGQKFDFFFIDADKVNYPNYLDWAIKLANSGALIIGDNILMHGRANDPNVSQNAVEQMRKFTRSIAEDPRLESALLPAFDGLSIARVR